MAKQTIVRVTDDLGDGTADTTLQFGVNGVNYEIDLSKSNVKAFNEAIEIYVAAARRVSGPARKTPAEAASRRSAVSAGGKAKVDLTAIRQWAAQAGHKVAERGRISAAVVEAFHAASADTPVLDPKPAQAPVQKVATKKSAPVARKPAAKRAPAKKAGARKPAAKVVASEPEAAAPASA